MSERSWNHLLDGKHRKTKIGLPPGTLTVSSTPSKEPLITIIDYSKDKYEKRTPTKIEDLVDYKETVTHAMDLDECGPSTSGK